MSIQMGHHAEGNKSIPSSIYDREAIPGPFSRSGYSNVSHSLKFNISIIEVLFVNRLHPLLDDFLLAAGGWLQILFRQGLK